MRRASEGGHGDKALDVDAALARKENLYYEVREGDDRLGFIAFRPFGASAPEDTEFHTCLLTVGSRTIFAIRCAIAQATKLGFRNFWGVFPRWNRGACRVTDAMGFRRMSAENAATQIRLLAI